MKAEELKSFVVLPLLPYLFVAALCTLLCSIEFQMLEAFDDDDWLDYLVTIKALLSDLKVPSVEKYDQSN